MDMSLWERLQAFIKKFAYFVKDFVKEFIIGTFFQVAGFPTWLTALITVLTARGHKKSKRIFIDERGYVRDQYCNVIGYVDQWGRVVLYEDAAIQYVVR